MNDMESNKDQDNHVKQLKRDLEGWREIILPLSSIFLWKKNSFPLILTGASTTFFTLFWYLDPSVLTTIAVFGLIGTLVECAVPCVMTKIYPPEDWNGTKEKKFESFCRNLSSCQTEMTRYASNFYNLRNSRPKVYYPIVVVSLLLLAFLGNTINNLLLTYIFVTFVLLLPGMKHQGLLEKYCSSAMTTLSGFTSGLKEKSN